MRNSGTWDAIQKRMEENRPKSICLKDSNDAIIAVDYKTTITLFLILCIGIILSIVNVCVEAIFHNKR